MTYCSTNAPPKCTMLLYSTCIIDYKCRCTPVLLIINNSAWSTQVQTFPSPDWSKPGEMWAGNTGFYLNTVSFVLYCIRFQNYKFNEKRSDEHPQIPGLSQWPLDNQELHSRCLLELIRHRAQRGAAPFSYLICRVSGPMQHSLSGDLHL